MKCFDNLAILLKNIVYFSYLKIWLFWYWELGNPDSEFAFIVTKWLMAFIAQVNGLVMFFLTSTRDEKKYIDYYSVFQGFTKAKSANGGSILSSSQF